MANKSEDKSVRALARKGCVNITKNCDIHIKREAMDLGIKAWGHIDFLVKVHKYRIIYV